MDKKYAGVALAISEDSVAMNNAEFQVGDVNLSIPRIFKSYAGRWRPKGMAVEKASY
ncbi:hypothetical protein [Burkholderia singularis]|uniref:hypothetical protein n=1 Tax=Burkholderia singularis TaxID=1503053 RepID=UPI0013596BE1|nr:hypothetical protein [Burkholderia singularis]